MKPWRGLCRTGVCRCGYFTGRFSSSFIKRQQAAERKERDTLRPIIEKKSIAYAVAAITNEEIDQINILQASYKAMHISVKQIKNPPGFLLVDGNRFKPYNSIPHQCIIKGDGKYASIAAASILAKTYRG